MIRSLRSLCLAKTSYSAKFLTFLMMGLSLSSDVQRGQVKAKVRAISPAWFLRVGARQCRDSAIRVQYQTYSRSSDSISGRPMLNTGRRSFRGFRLSLGWNLSMKQDKFFELPLFQCGIADVRRYQR